MTTSFKKKTCSRGRISFPTGTKPSLHNNQLLISSGVPSFDAIIGGGLAVGTLLLLEEDEHASYSNVLQRLFMAEGVASNQSLFLSSADKNPDDFLMEIPSSTNEETSSQPTSKQDIKDSEGLKIAWRYQNQPKMKSTISNPQFGHYFDLSETISADRIKQLKCTCFCPKNSSRDSTHTNPKYKSLLSSIKNVIDKEQLSTINSKTIPSVLRINLHSLGSPYWNESLISSDNYNPSLAWFLLALRSLLRTSYACCITSIPTHLFEDPAYVRRIEQCCDTVVRLESFASSEKNSLYKDYHGLFHVKKLAALNCIVGHNIDTTDLAFKLKRKKFSIEKLHLPPDVSETASRSQNNASSIKSGTPLCSANTPINNLLDF